MGSQDNSYKSGSFDGAEWEWPKAVASVMKLNLPHLEPLLVAFLKGSLEGWAHFSQEFAPGSQISQSTDEDRHLAWML